MKKAICYLILLLVALPVFAYEPEDTYIAKPGTMPLILTVPHDGDDSLGFFINPRKEGIRGRDEGTRILAERIVDFLENKTGLRPYLIINKTHRRFVDQNRAPSEAVENPDALPAYEAYHRKIEQYISEAKVGFPKGVLLIDVHAQDVGVETIYRGSSNLRTMNKMIDKYGAEVVSGPESIMGVLESKGYTIFPASKSEDQTEYTRFNGGFTVRKYSAKKYGIAALQMEFGIALTRSRRLAEDVADVLYGFTKKYLPE